MVAMKGAIPHTTPFFLAATRLLPAGVLVLIAGAIARRPQPTTRKAWLWIALFALIDGALFQGFLAWGLTKTGAGLGSVAIDSQPLIVAVLSWWLFGEFIGFWGWLGLLTGVVGISAIGLPDAWISQLLTLHDPSNVAIEASVSYGEGLMLLAAASMALGTVMMPKVSQHVDPVVATGWHAILGGVPLAALSFTLESEPWQHLTVIDWGALAYSTTFGTALAYGLFFSFAARGNLTSLSSLTFFTPVFALLFGYLLLGEVLTLVQSLGALVTLVSVYLIERRQHLPLPSFARPKGMPPSDGDRPPTEDANRSNPSESQPT